MNGSLRTGRKVPTRRMDFEESLATITRHFAGGGDVVTSHFAAGLSATFPEGEAFFVRSVRHFRDEISDPELRGAVAGFIGQETMHARQHSAFNERLAELGYPAPLIDRIVRCSSRLRETVLWPKANLAVTAALEHFTATIAELVLREVDVRGTFGDGPVGEVFVWHSLEELEHKSVAFDVYRAVGGNESLRIAAMKFIRAEFVLSIIAILVVSLATDPQGRRLGVLIPSVRRFLSSPWASRATWRQLRDYDRRGFHPDDHNTSELSDDWRTKLFGPTGTLNSRLATTASGRSFPSQQTDVVTDAPVVR